ncbi:MAG: branched-chain amino acid ABC transporter permease [Acidobacteriota bacterium]
MTASDLATVVASGLLLGALYGFMSYGLGLIYGVMKVVNLAHGAFLTLGAYGSFWLFSTFGVDPLLSILVTAPAGFFLGVSVEVFLVRKIRASPPIASLLLLFGVWLVVKNALYLLFTGNDRSVLTSYTFHKVNVGVSVSFTRLLVFAVSLVCFAALHVLLKRTRLGCAIRAVSQDREAAALAGIDVDRIWGFTFGLGSALATSAGSLMALVYSFNPEFGGSFLLKSFCVVVLGGMESALGILLGGFILGLTESLSVLVLPASLQDLLSFGLLVAVLVLRPASLQQPW